MKTKIILWIAVLLVGVVSPVWAENSKKEKAEVTFLVSMTCENCQKRIESNIPYEKGVTGLKVNLSEKLVTIQYRTDKTDAGKLKKAIQKLGYTATPFQVKKTDKYEKVSKERKR